MSSTRMLPVLNSHGGYVDDAPLIMIGAMHYPTCVQSIFHFRDVMGRDGELTPGKYSQIGKVISKDVVGRKRQGHLSGYLALKLIEMSVHGPPPSIGMAEYLTVKYAEESTIDGAEFRPRTPEAIRKCFLAYKPVCHLWAAQVAFLDLFIESATSLVEFAKFLSAAATFEEKLEEIGKPKDWSPWRIPGRFRGEFEVRVPNLSEHEVALLAQYKPVYR